jgi:nucleoside-diphosphate-sugar epimerase
MSSLGAYSPKRDDRPVDEAYPTSGIASSPYSRHKVAAERLLDDVEAREDVVVTRLRPGIIGQRRAGSSLLRYGVPALVPGRLVRAVPLVPLDRAMVISMVHADDVADALVRCIEGRAPGPFNLAAGAVTADDIAQVLGARHVQVPAAVLRAAVSLSWHARLQQVDPGWVDLARHAPVLDADRAHRELGWRPTRSARQVLAEIVDGIADAASGSSPVLRARSVPRELAALLRRGPVSQRRKP